MKKIPAALVVGLAMIAVTLLLFFTFSHDTSLEAIHILGISSIVLAEAITTAYACFTKGSPRRTAAVMFSAALIPTSIVLTVLYTVAFPDSYTTFVLLYCVGLVISNVGACMMFRTDSAKTAEDTKLQDAKGNMLMMRKMVKCVMADAAAAPYEARLMALEEDLHFSNDSVISENDGSIRLMLAHLQAHIADPDYDVEGQIEKIEKAVQMRKILTSKTV